MSQLKMLSRIVLTSYAARDGYSCMQLYEGLRKEQVSS